MTRYIRSFGHLYTVRTARKRYLCNGSDVYGVHFIAPGDTYTKSALPPFRSDVGNDRWWMNRLCTECMEVPDGA